MGHRLPAPRDALAATPSFPAPGTDGNTDLDFIPVPPMLSNIRIHLPSRRAPEVGVSPKTEADWAQAKIDKPFCAYVIPLNMAYRPETAGSQLDSLAALATVLRRNFTSSPNLDVLPPKPAITQLTTYAYPWAFLVTGLCPEDVQTLTHYHIWFTKHTQFAAFDAHTHTSNFVGCFKDLLLGPKDAPKVCEAFSTGFKDPSSAVHKFICRHNIHLDETVASLKLSP